MNACCPMSSQLAIGTGRGVSRDEVKVCRPWYGYGDAVMFRVWGTVLRSYRGRWLSGAQEGSVPCSLMSPMERERRTSRGTRGRSTALGGFVYNVELTCSSQYSTVQCNAVQ